MDIQSQYESILTASTKFPRAGSTNQRLVMRLRKLTLESWSLQIGQWIIGDFLDLILPMQKT